MTASQPQTTSTPPPSRRMSLANVVRGRIAKPLRVLLFGVEGVGKSTFGANAPSPIFLGAEDGTSELDVARFPQPGSWDEALEAIAELTRAEHDHKTLVIDTVDWLEPLCWSKVVERASDKDIKTIEDFGYGKGYVAALDEWRVLLASLERLRSARGMHIVLLAHSWIKTFKNPEAEDFDRYELKLHAKAGGLLKEWCDAVLFAQYETYANKDSKTKRVRGVSTGARIVQTQRTAAWDAKNRYDLPETLPLDWEAFAEAVTAHRPADPGILHARITGMLTSIADNALATRVRAAVEAANGNAAELARIADKLAATVNIKNQENGQ